MPRINERGHAGQLNRGLEFARQAAHRSFPAQVVPVAPYGLLQDQVVRIF
jgi:hypothetical protein